MSESNVPLEEHRIPEAMRAYISRLLELGAVEGPSGAVELHSDIAHILQALHHVVSGGKVEVRVTEPGDPQNVERLGALVLLAMHESNAMTR